jgi:hypothetical protein
MNRRCDMRKGFRTTLDEDLLSQLKIKAIQKNVDVNDILEKLIAKYLNGEIQIEVKKNK